MKFAEAMEMIQQGGRVSREGWHGACFVFIEPERKFEPPESPGRGERAVALCMTFAEAREALRQGDRVSRETWDGTRFAFLEPTRWHVEPPEGHPLHGFVTTVAYTGFLAICDVRAKTCSPWSPQREDEADNWCTAFEPPAEVPIAEPPIAEVSEQLSRIPKQGGRLFRDPSGRLRRIPFADAYGVSRFVPEPPPKLEPPPAPRPGIMTSFPMICDVRAAGCAPWSPQPEDKADDWSAVMN